MRKKIDKNLTAAQLQICDLNVSCEPDMDLGKQVALLSLPYRKNEKLHVVNPIIPDNYNKESPEKIYSDIVEDGKQIKVFDHFNYKQIISVYDTQDFILSESGPSMYLSEVLLYRYDKNQNERFVLLEIGDNKEDKIDVFLPIVDNYYEFYYSIFSKALANKQNYTDFKNLFYRSYTSNKSNDYKGYAKQSEIPIHLIDRASKKLALLSSYVTKYSNKEGFNAFSILLAWFYYWYEHRSSEGIKCKLIGTEREHFVKLWNSFETALTLL